MLTPGPLSTVYVTWTDDDGRRQVRTFAGGRGAGKLRRRLKGRGIPYESGAVASAGHATTPHRTRPWRADPRVGRPTTEESHG